MPESTADLHAEAPEPPSPCINVCRMDPRTGLCEGCLRTLEEIAAWSRMSPDEKRAVLRRLPSRGGAGR